MDSTLQQDIIETRKFVLQTLKKVRDNELDIKKAETVNKGAKEMVALGKLELEISRFTKD